MMVTELSEPESRWPRVAELTKFSPVTVAASQDTFFKSRPTLLGGLLAAAEEEIFAVELSHFASVGILYSCFTDNSGVLEGPLTMGGSRCSLLCTS